MNLARVFFGAVIVAVGVLFLLDNLGALDAGETIGAWWPLALIGGGVISLLSNRRHWIVPILLIGGGALVLLRTTGVIESLDVLLPALIIVVGLLFLFGRGLGSTATDAGTDVNTFNLFSGSELSSSASDFKGGRIGALFGGVELDLRNAGLAPDARIDVFAAFAGVEITVPRGWQVVISGFPIFGGYENATAKDDLSGDSPKLQIDATVLFGGLEIKH